MQHIPRVRNQRAFVHELQAISGMLPAYFTERLAVVKPIRHEVDAVGPQTPCGESRLAFCAGFWSYAVNVSHFNLNLVNCCEGKFVGFSIGSVALRLPTKEKVSRAHNSESLSCWRRRVSWLRSKTTSRRLGPFAAREAHPPHNERTFKRVLTRSAKQNWLIGRKSDCAFPKLYPRESGTQFAHRAQELDRRYCVAIS